MGNGQVSEVDIRPWSEEDLPLLERLLGDPAMMEHLGGPESLEKIRKRHELYVRMNEGDKGRIFVIVVGPERVAAGSVGYWETEWRGQIVWESGWSVLPEFQGQGIATKGIVAAVQMARAEGKHRYIHAFPLVDNGPSNAVCRKAGFTWQGVYDAEYPAGHPVRSNDWSLELFAATPEPPSLQEV